MEFHKHTMVDQLWRTWEEGNGDLKEQSSSSVS